MISNVSTQLKVNFYNHKRSLFTVSKPIFTIIYYEPCHGRVTCVYQRVPHILPSAYWERLQIFTALKLISCQENE